MWELLELAQAGDIRKRGRNDILRIHTWSPPFYVIIKFNIYMYVMYVYIEPDTLFYNRLHLCERANCLKYRYVKSNYIHIK